MNAAARLVCSARKYEHITPLLRDLHWLRVPERIEFKLSVLVFRCLHGAPPLYTEHHPTKTEKLVRSLLKSDSLLRTVLEGRMEGTRTRGRQNDTMIVWMKSNDVEYDHIKKRAHDGEDWRLWRPGSA